MGRKGRILTAIAPPYALYLAHAFVFGRWIVDDAGISFAYARSLAGGHGLVSQAGQPPVEGFTNLLWVLLLAIPMRLQMFDPVLTPKLMGAVLVLLAFALVAGILVSASGRPAWLAAAALSMTATSTGFALWSISGLENALYAGLIALLCFLAVRIGRGGGSSRACVMAGFVGFLVFITRPDGVLYLPLVPLFLGLGAASPGWGRKTSLYGAAFALPWFVVTGFRVVYFRDVLPNTYYAKQGVGWAQTAGWMEYGPHAAGIVYCAVAAAALAVVIWVSVRGGRALRSLVHKPPQPTVVLAAFFAVAFLIRHLLSDWMPASRFGTPAILLGPAAVLGGAQLWAEGAGSRSRPWFRALVGAALLLVAGVGAIGTHRLLPTPTISLENVRHLSLQLANTAAAAGIREPTVMLPDVGGALWEDRFRVVDLGGLSDRVIGRTLFADRMALYDYIFRTRRPDMIWIHGYGARYVALPRDARLREQYRSVLDGGEIGDSIPDIALYVRRDRTRVPLDSLRRVFDHPSPEVRTEP